MKNNLILVFLLCGVVSMAGCGTLKSVGGYFANIGEAVIGADKDPEEPVVDSGQVKNNVEPFKPTPAQVSAGKSIVGWLFFAFAITGVVFLVRLLYLRRINKQWF